MDGSRSDEMEMVRGDRRGVGMACFGIVGACEPGLCRKNLL